MKTLMFTRPAQWADMEDDQLRLVHADVFGPEPKLRKGPPMADNVGGVVTRASLNRLVEQFEEVKPDAFLFWSMYCEEDSDKRQLESIRAALARCREVSPRTVFMYGNGNQASAILEKKPDFNVDAYSNVIDVILDNTDDDRVHQVYKKRGYRVDRLYQFGFDPDQIRGHEGCETDHDVFFGGSYTGRTRFPNSAFRHDLLVRVAGESKLLLRGRGKWPAVVKRKGYVHGWKYVKEFNRCKVALGCNHADLARYYTKRTVYALASGRPYVVRYIPGMEHDFNNEHECIWYHTVDEAISIIKELVNNPRVANSIGEAGRERAVVEHSWSARLDDMREILGRRL